MKTKIITKILACFKGPYRTGYGVIEQRRLFLSDDMITGLYDSWCVKCGEPNHCGYFRVNTLGELDVVCNSCRMAEAQEQELSAIELDEWRLR